MLVVIDSVILLDCILIATDCLQITSYYFGLLCYLDVLFAPIFMHCAIIACLNQFVASMSTNMVNKNYQFKV